MNEEVTILIVDDHPVIRRGLREILEAETGFHVVGEAGEGEAALEIIRARRPRVVLLDIEMPGMTGLDVAACVQREELPCALLVLSMYEEESIFNRALDLGVTGYLVKDSADDDIVLAIRSVAQGNYFISPRLASRTMKRRRASAPAEIALQMGQLTVTERYVLRLIARSKTTRDIGEKLAISPRTVERHRYKICQKLNLAGSYSLLRFALEHRQELDSLD